MQCRNSRSDRSTSPPRAPGTRHALLWIGLAAATAACSARGISPGGGGGVDAGGDPGPGMIPTGEVCGDMLDNDGNGLVEEGCACDNAGDVQPCWAGPALRRGTGSCHDGVQYCESYGEFLAWGPCTGAQLPAAEIDGDCIDDDCDGVAPGCPMGCAEFESCGPDGVDDDCDGYVDCLDPDCRGNAACASGCVPSELGEECTDGRDNDCDGIADCMDTDCRSYPSCRMDPPPPPGCTAEFPFFAEIACGDGRDNDCDGRIDCADSDCRRPGTCGCATREAMCSDGMDDDCDGSTDCDDLECQRCTPGTFRWCDEPSYCHWGRQECRSDGTFGPCVETSDRPGTCTGTLYSASCCVSAGGCCQNYPVDDESIGDCATIVTCR